ncbi:hypothetical protein GCM10022227_24710 [Streptomyces sedi]
MFLGLISTWITFLAILLIPDGPTRFAELLLSPFNFGDPETLPMKFVFRAGFALLTLMLIFYGLAELFPDRFARDRTD